MVLARSKLILLLMLLLTTSLVSGLAHAQQAPSIPLGSTVQPASYIAFSDYGAWEYFSPVSTQTWGSIYSNLQSSESGGGMGSGTLIYSGTTYYPERVNQDNLRPNPSAPIMVVCPSGYTSSATCMTTSATPTLTISSSSTSISCSAPYTVASAIACTVSVSDSHASTTVTVTTSDTSTGVFTGSGTGIGTDTYTCALSSGRCSFTYIDTAVGGIPTLTATFAGSDSNFGSTGTTSFTVGVAPFVKTSTTTSISCPTTSAGNPTTCIVTVSGNSPIGYVDTFKTSDGTGTFGSSVCTLSSGLCTFQYTDTAVGSTTISATYEGDTYNLKGTGSGTLAVTVSMASTATYVSCPAAVVGTSTTCTVTVTGSSPSGTATVTTSDTSTGIFTGSGTGTGTDTYVCPLSSGSCSFQYKDTAVGTPTITATYSGDTYNTGSASAATPVTVSLPPTSTAVSLSTSTSAYGHPVTITATVSPAVPNGETVVFYANGATIGAGSTTGGVATLTTSSLPYGTDQITAYYAGDDSYAPSTSPESIEAVSPPAGVSTTAVYNQLPINTLNWLPLAGVAILAVMTVAAFVYMLSSVAASPNAKRWARVQIYEALLSMIMLLFFGAFSYMFFINPQTAYQSLDLVPQDVTFSGSYSFSGIPMTISGCRSSAGDPNSNIFALSMCDLNYFNGIAYNIGELMLWIPFITGIVPGLSIGISPWEGIAVSVYTASFLPPTIGNIFSMGLKAFLSVLLLNQVQVYLLACAPFFLAFFITIGLVSRTLGFTRSFGGAMIALGLGLGLVYPLLISITYGYVDVQLWTNGIGNLTVGSIFGAIWPLFRSSVFGTAATSALSNMMVLFCDLIAGFTFLPFLNFMILDAFIVDFSKAFGEKLDFMSLLSGLV